MDTDCPVIVMTSDKSDWVLKGFFHQWHKYSHSQRPVVVCGYRQPEVKAEFFKIGEMDDYPINKWSNSLLRVLDYVEYRYNTQIFQLMLDDYWLVRDMDEVAVKHLIGYMRQFQNVLKIDLGTDRLYAFGGTRHSMNFNTYGRCAYLDLILSVPESPYHFSLWGGLWRTSLMRQVIKENESAQEMEILGTMRLSNFGFQMLVLGTRQAPMLHTNILRGGNPVPIFSGYFNTNPVPDCDLKEMGYDTSR